MKVGGEGIYGEVSGDVRERLERGWRGDREGMKRGWR